MEGAFGRNKIGHWGFSDNRYERFKEIVHNPKQIWEFNKEKERKIKYGDIIADQQGQENWLKEREKEYGVIAKRIAPQNGLNVNEGIKEFVQKIPLDNAQFWQQLPKENAAELVDLVVAISKEFVTNLVEMGERDRAVPNN